MPDDSECRDSREAERPGGGLGNRLSGGGSGEIRDRENARLALIVLSLHAESEGMAGSDREIPGSCIAADAGELRVNAVEQEAGRIEPRSVEREIRKLKGNRAAGGRGDRQAGSP